MVTVPDPMDHGYQGVYLPTPDPATFESTPLANAGWYEEGQHGGAVAALIAAVVENVPTLAPMELARLTVELFRVVPLVPLTVSTRVVREGKRIQTVEATVAGPDGTILSVAIAQRLRIADRPLPQGLSPSTTTLAMPEDGPAPDIGTWGHGAGGKIMFHRNAIEVREIHGGFDEPGPGAIWVRLTTPIIAGEVPSPAQRAIVVADFCNGVSRSLGRDWVFMNSDLTVHLGRLPAGEWVALDAVSNYEPAGRGVASGTLWDTRGWVGRSAQTLFLERVN